MTPETHTTKDHDEIRQWVESNDGVPASVRTAEDTDATGMLRFDFPGGAGADELEHITWDAWFDTFDQEGLALVYQNTQADGAGSTFFKVVADD